MTTPALDRKALAGFFGIVKQDLEQQEQKRNAAQRAAALRKAKALAKRHGIEITHDTALGGWYVECDHVDPANDPLEDDHYTTIEQEVLEKVAVYIEHFAEA